MNQVMRTHFSNKFSRVPAEMPVIDNLAAAISVFEVAYIGALEYGTAHWFGRAFGTESWGDRAMDKAREILLAEKKREVTLPDGRTINLWETESNWELPGEKKLTHQQVLAIAATGSYDFPVQHAVESLAFEGGVRRHDWDSVARFNHSMKENPCWKEGKTIGLYDERFPNQGQGGWYAKRAIITPEGDLVHVTMDWMAFFFYHSHRVLFYCILLILPFLKHSDSMALMLMIRLQRVGRIHEPKFRVVLTDSKNGPKSGKYVEVLGWYDARIKNDVKQLEVEKIKHWISKGAKLSDTLHNFLVHAKAIAGKKVNALPKRTPTKKEVAPEAAPAAGTGPAAAAPAAPAQA